MQSRLKLWATAGLFLSVGIVSLLIARGVSANKTAAGAAKAPARQAGVTRITLHADAVSSELRFKDAADLEETPDSTGATGSPKAITFGDVNADGRKDLVAAYAMGDHTDVKVRFTNDNEELTSSRSFRVEVEQPTSIAVGDFNGDGIQDIAVGSEKGVALLYGRGNAEFTAGPVLKAGAVTALTAADLDKDGLTELIAVDSAGAAHIFMNQGKMDAENPSTIDLRVLGSLTDVKAGEFNRDHHPDLVVAGERGVAVLYGRGDGSFRKPRILGTSRVNSLAVADLDGDHFDDVAAAGDRLTIWHSRGTRGLSAPSSVDAGSNLRAVESGAFAHHALTDLAVTDGAGRISVLLNKDGREFGAPIDIQVDGSPSALATGFRHLGIDTLAVAHESGVVVAVAASGGTVVVSTTADELDCLNCTVAQGLAICGTNGAPGGSTGVSLREAITWINNDNAVNATTGWTISFTGIHSNTIAGTCGSPGQNGSVPHTCLANPSTFWLIRMAFPNTTTPQNLPPFIAAGTTIDGSLVDTSSTGVNNTLGPKVYVTGVPTGNGGDTQKAKLFNISSSAPNCTIKNMGIVGSLGDGITVSSQGDTFTGNSIGLDCDTKATLATVNIQAGIDFLSGTTQETVSNNTISNNGVNGITINGVSQSTATPQNNTISANLIGLNVLTDAAHNTGAGIMLQNGAVGNTISGNSIDANTVNGIEIDGNITSDTIIQNNKIGTDPAGVTDVGSDSVALGNGNDGIFVGNSGNPKFNAISQNVISGNVAFGVVIDAADFNAQFNTMTANKVGVNVAGSVQLPNGAGGLGLALDANNNTIGGTSAAAGNQISGNGQGGDGGGGSGPGIDIGGNANNNLIQDNLIGPNNLAAGGGAPTDVVNGTLTSNKGGGIVLVSGAFANRIVSNVIAFNNDNTAASGIAAGSAGNFNTFSQNQIFVNPANSSPTTPQIVDSNGQQGMMNGQVTNGLTSLIRVTTATTITTGGQTTITGTANFLTNGVTANINGPATTVEVFASQRGSTSAESQSEAQAFIGNVSSFQVDPTDPSGHTVDWSVNAQVPAPFFNPVQTPTLFITATITTGDGSTSPLSLGFVAQFVTQGGQCNIQVAPSVVSFNNGTIGHTSTQNVVITNTGTVSLTVSQLNLNQSGTQFGLGSVTLPATLAPSGTLTVPVSFTPSSTSSVAATLSINNSCTSTITVPITGNATTSKIAVIPSSLVFGSVNVGQSASLNLTVINFGSGTLSITALSIAGGATSPFSVTSPAAVTASTPFNISGLSTGTVTVKFAPTATGSATDTLTIVSNDPVNPSLGVGLSGSGVNTTPPSVLVTQPSAGALVSEGSSFQVIFVATPASGATLVSYSAALSTNGGVSFSPIGGGSVGGVLTTFNATAPNTGSTAAVVQIKVTDSNGNTGTGLSGTFTIGTPPTITGAVITKKLVLTGANIQTGAVVLVQGEAFLLNFNGSSYVVAKSETGSGGDRIRDLVSPGQTVTIFVKNPDGLQSAGFSVTR